MKYSSRNKKKKKRLKDFDRVVSQFYQEQKNEGEFSLLWATDVCWGYGKAITI